MWIGTNANCGDQPGNITWVKKGCNIKIPGVYFSAEKEASLIEENWKGRIEKVQNIIKAWQKRDLSLYGKIIICKTYLLAQFTFLIQALTLPPHVLDEIDTIMFKFLWKKKFSNARAYEKVKRGVLCKPVTEGGLGMISIKTQQKFFQLKWLQKIYKKNL